MGIANMRLLLDALDNPEKNFKVIHVAGTNGRVLFVNSFQKFLKKMDIQFQFIPRLI